MDDRQLPEMPSRRAERAIRVFLKTPSAATLEALVAGVRPKLRGDPEETGLRAKGHASLDRLSAVLAERAPALFLAHALPGIGEVAAPRLGVDLRLNVT